VLAVSVVIGAAGSVVLAPFLGHWCGRVCRMYGEAGKGVWGETWNRAAWGARGGSGFPPSDFKSPFPCCFFTHRAEP
jgi:hypothetical protein